MNDRERQIRDFINDIRFDDAPDHQHRDELEKDLLRALAKAPRQQSVHAEIWRTLMKSRTTRWSTAAAAVVIITLLGGINFWPGHGSGNGQWWLGPPAAWGRDILASLEKVQAIVYRQRSFKRRDYGPDTFGSLWEKRYAAENAYRKDVYDEANNIYTIQWTVPRLEGVVKYQIWPEYQCYTQTPENCPPFMDNVMGWLRRWMNFLDRADRVLGTETFEGHRCVGFELRPGQYDGFFVGERTRIWFDTETKLPVRVERHDIRIDYDPTATLILIHDQFDYYAEVPIDMFTPDIPEGFVNAHPDEIIAARKSKMVFADVPPELRDDILAALGQVKTAAYEHHLEVTADGDVTVYPAKNIYTSRYSWCEDSFSWIEGLRKIEWYVIDKDDVQGVSIDLDDNDFRLTRTTVSYKDKTYSVATDTKVDGYGHPMRYISFLAGLVNKADRMLEHETIEGVECFGVEISANKYGNNSDRNKHRLWFDVETKLPVRMEFEYWQSDGTTKSLRVFDRFQWDPELPDDTFTPRIPEGFTLVEADER